MPWPNFFGRRLEIIGWFFVSLWFFVRLRAKKSSNFTRHFEHMCIQDLSVHPLMKCTADMSDAFAISLPDERWKSRCFYCLATYKKDNFSWFSVFFIISKWFKLLFLLLLPSSSSCPAWRKPVAHWGNWPEDFSCPSQILHAPGQ